jgi:arylsulfatase A
VEALKESGLERDTFIFFCSDNGPGNRSENPGGSSAGPLRGYKFDTFEGGQRVPAIAWAPGTVKAGSESDAMTSTLDLLPTIAHYAGIPLDESRVYDGYDLSDLFSGASDKSPRRTMYFYAANTEQIDGIRFGDWKYLREGSKFETGTAAGNKPLKRTGEAEPMLFNLKDDIGEATRMLALPE